jgi:hypothetical protein
LGAGLTLDELIAEGEQLARPSWILRTQPTESAVAGFWGGERSDLPNALPPEVTVYQSRRHIVTLSELLLAEIGVQQGPVSLFEWEPVAGDPQVRVEADQRLRLRDLQFSGEPLFATPEPSFPPFAVVCLYGSSRVAEWLAAQGLARHDYWRVIDDLQVQYTTEWQRRSAFCRNAGDLIVGGWHFLWPEDDFFVPPELQLIALTLRDAEPWFEIWHSRPRLGFHARKRIT